MRPKFFGKIESPFYSSFFLFNMFFAPPIRKDTLYHEKLQSGVPVHFYRYSGMAHAFFEHTGEFPQAEDCTNEMAKLIKAM